MSAIQRIQPVEEGKEKNKFPSVVLRIMKPILIPSSYFGFFPCCLTSDYVISPQSNLALICSYLIGCFVIPSSLHHLYNIGLAINNKGETSEIVKQILWFSSSIIQVILYSFSQFRRQSFISLVTTCEVKEKLLWAHVPFQTISSFGHRLILFYGVLTFASAATIVIHSVYNPNAGQYFLRHWWPSSEDVIPLWAIIIQSILVAINMTWIWVGTTIFEVWCCLRAQAIILCFQQIQIATVQMYELEKEQSKEGNGVWMSYLKN